MLTVTLMCIWYCLHMLDNATHRKCIVCVICIYVGITHFHCHNYSWCEQCESAAFDHHSFPDPLFCIMSLNTFFPPSHKVPLHCQVFRDLKEGRHKEANYKVKYIVGCHAWRQVHNIMQEPYSIVVGSWTCDGSLQLLLHHAGTHSKSR